MGIGAKYPPKMAIQQASLKILNLLEIFCKVAKLEAILGHLAIIIFPKAPLLPPSGCFAFQIFKQKWEDCNTFISTVLCSGGVVLGPSLHPKWPRAQHVFHRKMFKSLNFFGNLKPSRATLQSYARQRRSYCLHLDPRGLNV